MCNTQMVDTSGEDYNILVTCATRYAIGRQSYMPYIILLFLNLSGMGV